MSAGKTLMILQDSALEGSRECTDAAASRHMSPLKIVDPAVNKV